ncbi:MAG: hypothetical protein RL693_135, partial [Verrucomicrobiota bacterium]
MQAPYNLAVIKNRHNIKHEFLWALVLALGCSAILYFVFSAVEYRWRWDSIWAYRILIMKGWSVTLMVSL